jgi:hypothetical protein
VIPEEEKLKVSQGRFGEIVSAKKNGTNVLLFVPGGQ